MQTGMVKPMGMNWYSAKWAGVKRACPNKVMAHMWFMHDVHLGRLFLFIDILAEYTLLSMTVMVTPRLKYVVGIKLVMSSAKFPQTPFARALFWRMPNEEKEEKKKKKKTNKNRGFARQGGFQKGGFGRCSPVPKFPPKVLPKL